MATVRAGILTVSDRCSQRQAEDRSGQILHISLANALQVSQDKIYRTCVADDIECISNVLKTWSDELDLDLIITTGGTGCSDRDVTPEATKIVIDKELPGLSVAMLTESLKITPMAMLSRSVCGIRKHTLIINFPGSPKACEECLAIVKPTVIKHAIDLLRNTTASNKLHTMMKDKLHIKSKVLTTNVANRDRQSPYPMVLVQEAQKIILVAIPKMDYVEMKTTDALGFVTATSVFAKDPFPPFRASIKDGYAVISGDGTGKRQVVSSSLAGFNEAPGFLLKSGECVRITTGAAVPDGSDAVVQVEDTKLLEESEGVEVLIEILKQPSPMQDIRQIGSDICKGSAIVGAEFVLSSSELGLLATARIQKVAVVRKPKIALLSTGNELQTLHSTPQRGKIVDSNKITLQSCLVENGFSSVDYGIAVDEPDILLDKIKNALENADILITTGGVSMGERDLVTDVLLQDLNAKIHFGRVNVKPGKPTKFFEIAADEKMKRSKFVFALPGNPVSAVVTCHLFVLPALRKMCGMKNPLPQLIKVELAADIKLDDRYEYCRAKLDWNNESGYFKAKITGNQISSRIMNLSGADCLLHLPCASESLKNLSSGHVVEAQILGLPS